MVEDPNKGYRKEDIDELHAFTGKFFNESMLGIAIFCVPAAIAIIAGKALDRTYGTNKIITLALVLVGLVISWVIVLRRNKKIVSHYRDIRAKMEKNKEKE